MTREVGGQTLNIIKGILIGLVQGITEFLPLSSSGHQVILREILHIQVDDSIYFQMMLHIGVFIALMIVFYRDFIGVIRSILEILATIFANIVIRKKIRNGNTNYHYFKMINTAYKKLSIMIIISSIITYILMNLSWGLVEMASNTLWIVGIGMLLSSGLLVIADQRGNGRINTKNANYSGSIIVGMVQGVGLIPGISRTGITITFGRILGYNRKLAVKYSFLVWIPALIGIIIKEYSLGKVDGYIWNSQNFIPYLSGAFAAAITGVISIKFMLQIIKSNKYLGFAIYCAIMGIVLVLYTVYQQIGG